MRIGRERRASEADVIDDIDGRACILVLYELVDDSFMFYLWRLRHEEFVVRQECLNENTT